MAKKPKPAQAPEVKRVARPDGSITEFTVDPETKETKIMSESNGNKRSRRVKWTMDVALGTLTQAVDDIETRTFRPFADLVDAINRQLTLHGLKQKLSDGYSQSADNAAEVAAATYAVLSDGNWYAPRGQSAERMTYFIQAVAELKYAAIADMDDRLQTAKSFVNSLDEKMVDEFAKIPQVVDIINRLSAEALAKRNAARTESATGDLAALLAA